MAQPLGRALSAAAQTNAGGGGPRQVGRAAGVVATSSVSQFSITGFGATGQGDDTDAIQAAFDAAMPNTTIVIPSGVFTYSRNLTLRGKSQVKIVGAGPLSILRAADPARSAIEVVDSDGLEIAGFTIEAAGSSRSQASAANGLNLRRVTDAVVSGITVRRTAGAGIYLEDSSRVTVTGCTVEDTLADGIHLVHVSDTQVLNCEGIRTGDDSFSSIGYESMGPNERVSIIGCRSVDAGASGVSFEGTNDGLASGCTVERSRVAGIRVQSASAYRTLGCVGIVVRGNTLRDCKTDPSVGHASIEVAAAYGDLIDIQVLDNSIWQPRSQPTHWVAYPPYRVEAVFAGNLLDGVPID